MPLLTARQRMGAAALILAASAVLSRLMGLVRDKVISWQFGAGGEADLYFAAFVVPDIINYLLAGGFMSITIIPLLAARFREDEADAWRFFSCVFFWMLVSSLALTVAGMIWAEQLARLTAPGFSPQAITRLAFFMRIILPAQVFFLAGACFTALLLLRRQFSVPALTPLIYNGAIIAMGLLLPLTPGAGALFGKGGHLGPDHLGMTGYCVGVTLGAGLGAFLLPLRAAAAGGLRLSFVWRHPLLFRFLLIALPLMLGQTVVMLDEQFLRVFGSLVGDGAVSLLNYGRRIAQVPVGLVGQAAAVASYPFLVRLLADGENERFAATLRTALAASVGLIIPCALLMMAAAWPILGIIFQGGRFGPEETLAALPLTRLMLAPAPFWIVYMVLVRAYYAHGDTLTPALTGTAVTLACIPLYYFLAVPQGAWAVAALSGLGVSAYVAWLIGIWARRHGTAAFAGLAPLAGRCLACSVPAAGIAWLVADATLARLPLPPFFAACAALAASGAAFALVGVPLARMVAPELIEMAARPLRERLARKKARDATGADACQNGKDA
ncbi:lipid II flippase MurJ [Desulfovibrio sp.]|uniref:murein biosynthesis integral membrane protein MurJ n=1 Tax=Desulfovibrio sp. TaxID=885 RepID=UPI0023CA5048|nr:lipid II flippase MurJ [Desulfovibrio sp.]MDE7241671.1 murein biosynthesis integral membrane protein MurJ [Desulfovibrio sp.]